MDAELKKNLLLSIAAVVLFFAVFEIALRFLYITSPSELYVPDAYLERRLAPNYHTVVKKADFEMDVQTNALGLRNPEIGPKQQGVKRILVLGDSYPFGFGVQEKEAFPARLEAWLIGHGRQAEVINAGVFGWSLDQEMLWFEREGAQLQPDVVVLGFYVGNDVLDSMDKKFFALRGGKLVRVKPEFSDADMQALELKSWLRKNIFTYAFLSEKIRSALAAAGQGKEHPVAEQEMFRAAYAPELEDGFRLVFALLTETVEATRGAGAKTLLVIIPSRLQYVRQKCAADVKCLPNFETDWEKPNHLLDAFAAGQGIPFLDLLPVFLARPDGHELNLPLDGHWNARGHEVAAEAIGEALLRQGLV